MNEETPSVSVVSTKVHKVKIDERFKDDALQKVQSYVKGNGIDPQEVKLASFEGELLIFEAYTDLVVVTKFAKKVVPGRMTGPVAVGGDVALSEAINKDYLTLFTDADSQRKIRDMFLKREDQGFGIQDVFMQIPFWKKEYVIFEPCQTCRTTGKIQCRSCAGKGMILCNRCAGSGKTFCSYCNGAKTVQNSQGQRMQCPTCYGQGKMSCNQCNQTGRMQCRTCATKGNTPCPNCQGHAWASNLTTVNIEAKTKFEYPREELPEKICMMIDELGDKIKEHAKIHVAETDINILKKTDTEAEKPAETDEKQKILHIPIFYEVSIPYGHIEFEIEGTSYYTFLFGIKGKLSHASPFLDELIKNGLRKLQDAVDGRGDVEKNILAAAQYRCVQSGILYASKYSPVKAIKKLLAEFPVGLSDKTAETIVLSSDTALKQVSKSPRRKGLALSALIQAGFFAGYLLTPLHKILESKIPGIPAQAALDGLISVSGIYIGAMVIQSFANRSLSDIIQKIAGNKDKNQFGAAKLGDSLFYNIGIGIVLFIILLEISQSAGFDAPAWYRMIRS